MEGKRKMPKNDNPQALRFLTSMAKHGKQEAGDRFAGEYPLGKSADVRKKMKWAKNLCSFLDENYDNETVKAIRMDCACEPSSAFSGKIRAIYEKGKDPYAFSKNINMLDLGFTLEYDGNSYILEYPQCYCSCVKRVDETLPRAWCYCTLGYNKRLFENIFGQEVRVELINSVKLGDAVCRIRITV